MMKINTRFDPAAPPPEGVTPSFDNPQDGFYTANLVTTSLSVGIVNAAFLIHAYVKLMVRRGRLLQEDCFCIAAWVLINCYHGGTLSMSYFGEGRSVWELSKEEYRRFLKSLYIASCFYTPAAFFTKVTILLLIARVFSVRPMISKSIQGFILLLVIAYVPIEFLKIFACHPISAYWDIPEKPGVMGDNPNCLGQAKFFMGDIVIALVTDLIILILPIPLTWAMEAPWRQKIKIIILLGAGGAATIATAIRAYLNVQFMTSNDVTKDFALSSISAAVELSVGSLCICLPSVNILLERMKSHLRLPPPCQGIQGTQTTPDSKTGGPMSSYWSSMKSIIKFPTIRTITTRGDQQDIAMGSQVCPVIFNKRLDLPSLRSTSDNRSCSSIDEYHRGPPAFDVECQFESGHDETPGRKDSGAALDWGTG